MLPALFTVGAAMAALPVAAVLWSVASDLWWGWGHHWTVAWEGERFHLPVGWRENGTPAGQHTLELRDAAREVLRLRSPDRITIFESQAAFDAEEMVVRWQRLQTRLMMPGETLEPAPRNGFLRQQYACADIKRSFDGEIVVTCFDKGGRWAISLRGRQEGVRDMAEIMESVTPDAAAAK